MYSSIFNQSSVFSLRNFTHKTLFRIYFSTDATNLTGQWNYWFEWPRQTGRYHASSEVPELNGMKIQFLESNLKWDDASRDLLPRTEREVLKNPNYVVGKVIGV